MIPLSRSILRGCGLSLLQPRLPALVGLRAAAVIAPLADAFDAAADAAALTLLTRSADVVSGAKAQKALISTPSAPKANAKPTKARRKEPPQALLLQRLSANKQLNRAQQLLRRLTLVFKNSVYFHILADTCHL